MKCFSAIGLVFLVFCTGGTTGCNDSGPLKLYPVAGQVTVKGKPAVGAQLAFFGLDERLKSPDAPFPRATVDASGNFVVSSYRPGDGAPAGMYGVTVVWRRAASEDPEIQDASADLLRGKYASPESSGITVTIVEGDNQLEPIDLK